MDSPKAATRVVASINNATADRCVDVFIRADGTFGFEEYRRDPEDARGWFPIGHYTSLSFASYDDALRQARRSVAWLADA